MANPNAILSCSEGTWSVWCDGLPVVQHCMGPAEAIAAVAALNATETYSTIRLQVDTYWSGQYGRFRDMYT